MTFDIWFQMLGGFKCCCVTLHSTPTSVRLWTFALCNFTFNPSVQPLCSTPLWVPLTALLNLKDRERTFPTFQGFWKRLILNIQLYLLGGTWCLFLPKACVYPAQGLLPCWEHADKFKVIIYNFVICWHQPTLQFDLCRLQPLPEVVFTGFLCQSTLFRNQTSVFKQRVGFFLQKPLLSFHKTHKSI